MLGVNTASTNQEVKMTKIDIKESEGGGASAGRPIRGQYPGHQSEASHSSKSPSPARREAGLPTTPKDTSSPQTSPPKAADENMSALCASSSSSRLPGQTVPLCSDKNREGVSNESGYFEDEDGLQREDSIEIIFDKNASNNNSGQSAGQSGRKNFQST